MTAHLETFGPMRCDWRKPLCREWADHALYVDYEGYPVCAGYYCALHSMEALREARAVDRVPVSKDAALAGARPKEGMEG